MKMEIALLVSFCLINFISQGSTTEINSTEDPRDYQFGCQPVQYVEFGYSAVVKCNFPHFNALYWYNSTQESHKPPIVGIVKGGKKSGVGYNNGDYNIFVNGTLVITTVSLDHERTFRIVCLDTHDVRSVYEVSLIVTVTASKTEPVIGLCPNNGVCIIAARDSMIIGCTFDGARPPVQLSWFERIKKRNEAKNSSIDFLMHDHLTFTSVSNISLAQFEKRLLVLLVCASNFVPMQVKSQETTLLDFSTDYDLHSQKTETLYFEINTRISLRCFRRRKYGNIIWKMEVEGRYENVAYKLPYARGSYRRSDFHVNEYGDLLIEKLTLLHEAMFACIFDDSSASAIRVIQVMVVVPPMEPHISVDGCPSVSNCTMSLKGNGSLSCKVSGSRPPVNLEWLEESPYGNVIDLSEEITVANISGLFEVSNQMKFTMSSDLKCNGYVSFECKAKGPVADFLRETTRKVIIYGDSKECKVIPRLKGSETVVIILGGILGLCILSTAGLCSLRTYRKAKQRPRPLTQIQEMQGEQRELEPLQKNVQSAGPASKKEIFIENLKRRYKFWTNQDNIFVSQCFCKIDATKFSSDKARYESLQSYNELFRSKEIAKKNLVVIEGEAGCGKSMFALKLASEWCKKMPDSPLNDFNIMIVLMLKDMKPNMTIYQVIKDQLISKDYEEIIEKDIEKMLKDETKYLLVLDGFDDYTERRQTKAKADYVHQIITNKIMRNSMKILLTRPTSYMRLYGNRFPIIRLEKFNFQQIEEYLKQKFPAKHHLLNLITSTIKEHDILQELCRIPFFLKMITEIFEEKRSVVEPAKTITKFFQRVVNLKLISTVKQTTFRKKTCMKFVPSENISQFAFDCTIKDENVWSEYDLRLKHVQKEEISRLIEMDIFIEINRFGNKASSKSALEENGRLLKFGHKIYQYFIAAHYLASIENPETFENLLEKIDALTGQYLLRFTCGLEKDKVRKIVETLLSEKDTFPYPRRDCIAYCIYEADLCNGKDIRDLLESLSTNDHGLEILQEDSKQLKIAKTSLINMCHEEKITLGNLKLVNAATQISRDNIHFNNGLRCRLPLIRTLIITDYVKKLDEKQILSTLQTLHSLVEMVVYSHKVPTHLENTTLDVLSKRKIIVIWIHYTSLGDDGRVIWYYPSQTFRCWMTPADGAVVRLMRLFKKKSELSEEDALQISLTKGWEEALRQIGFSTIPVKIFLNRTKVLLKTLKEILTLWQQVDDAPTEEDVEFYKKRLQEKIDVLEPLLKANWIERKLQGKDPLDKIDDKDETGTLQHLDESDYVSCRPSDKEGFIAAMRPYYWIVLV